MNRKKWINLIIITAVTFFVFLSIAGCSFMGVTIEPPKITVTRPAQAQVSKSSPVASKLKERKVSNEEILAKFDQAVSRVAEDVKPSIVNIKVGKMQEDIFGNYRQGEGTGSGIIYSPDGYIITNNHVASDANELIVTLDSGEEYPAEFIGGDENTDIAVIKIDAQGLSPAEFTSVNNAKDGELCIAIGSPFGLDESVTMGVISAVGRDVAISYNRLPLVDLIQTDAAINPGNSGGALVNSAGQVLGVNTMIYSTSGSNAGIGFAIPSDTALNIADKLINSGTIETPFIGIEMGENNTDIEGVFVSGVMEGYPAESAGLKQGDIITAVNGGKVHEPLELVAEIIKHEVGDNITLTANRNGNLKDFDLALIKKPEQVKG
ncbi:MAG: trypsin-like peptidase domain-containing protein [Actinomycetia bacterium]|nr:trypsin-like peptidase domain-containing protein [Actinomycetes bacterium]